MMKILMSVCVLVIAANADSEFCSSNSESVPDLFIISGTAKVS